jgi:hypothetical protein
MPAPENFDLAAQHEGAGKSVRESVESVLSQEAAQQQKCHCAQEYRRESPASSIVRRLHGRCAPTV